MAETSEKIPFRTKLKVGVSNFLQRNRGLLLALIGAVAAIIIGLAIWSQVDHSAKVTFAAKIEKSQADFTAWQAEADASKKAELQKALEAELLEIQKSAPVGYGLSKAWFLQGSYESQLKRWPEAAKAFHTVFEKDPGSYLAPIALVNSAVCWEEAGDVVAALGSYSQFEKSYFEDTLLGPQVFFTMGRLLEAQQKGDDAVVQYQKLVSKYPDSSWTKLARDRILLISKD